MLDAFGGEEVKRAHRSTSTFRGRRGRLHPRLRRVTGRRRAGVRRDLEAIALVRDDLIDHRTREHRGEPGHATRADATSAVLLVCFGAGRDEVLVGREAALFVGAESPDLGAVTQVEADTAALAAATAGKAEHADAVRLARIEDRPAFGVATSAVQLEQVLAVAHVGAASLPLERPVEVCL